MATLTLRTTKGSPLTNAEVDGNFTALNTEVGTKLDTTAYTAADVLTKIKTVDGAGSGLDADTLDGLNAASANTVSTIVARDASGNFSAGTITATGFSGPLTGNVTGNVSGTAGSVTGNAATATTLQTARTIGGVSFNGSANINLPGVNTAGNQNTSGSAATLTTARTIGGVSFNGSANINLPGVNTAGNQNTSGTAAGLSATLVVGSGGTGRTTLTANNVIIGNGTSAVSFVAPGTAGNVLTSNGTTWTSAALSPGLSTAKAYFFSGF